jgi:hypothetical protein
MVSHNAHYESLKPAENLLLEEGKKGRTETMPSTSLDFDNYSLHDNPHLRGPNIVSLALARVQVQASCGWGGLRYWMGLVVKIFQRWDITKYVPGPAKASIKAEQVTFTGSLRYNATTKEIYREIDLSQPQYVGSPSPEIDAAWDRLLHGEWRWFHPLLNNAEIK